MDSRFPSAKSSPYIFCFPRTRSPIMAPLCYAEMLVARVGSSDAAFVLYAHAHDARRGILGSPSPSLPLSLSLSLLDGPPAQVRSSSPLSVPAGLCRALLVKVWAKLIRARHLAKKCPDSDGGRPQDSHLNRGCHSKCIFHLFLYFSRRTLGS